jgi:hypothetical protein
MALDQENKSHQIPDDVANYQLGSNVVSDIAAATDMSLHGPYPSPSDQHQVFPDVVGIPPQAGASRLDLIQTS